MKETFEYVWGLVFIVVVLAAWLLGISIHIWTIVIAYTVSGVFSAGLTLMFPFLAEVYWFFSVGLHIGFDTLYCTAIMLYLILMGIFLTIIYFFNKPANDSLDDSKEILEENIFPYEEDNSEAFDGLMLEQNQVKTMPTVAYKELYKNIPLFLKAKGINKFYHFTDANNLQSIIEYGGLYSWHGIAKRNINATFSSDELSRELDTRKGLQDFVRLSFVENHPMKYIVKRKKDLTLVVLEIDLEVALWEDTLFSNMNATDKNAILGSNFEFLKKLDYNIFRQGYIDLEDIDKKPYQAEILIKDFLPIQYIKNIDELKERYLDDVIPF